MNIQSILLIGFGGGLGSILRHLLGTVIHFKHSKLSHFPLGTFTVNILGGFLIGLFIGISLKNNFINENWKWFLVTGFCGGFTTFSAFTNEGYLLLKNQQIGMFVFYFLISISLGLLATTIGYLISK